jgi:hypothetical protein
MNRLFFILLFLVIAAYGQQQENVAIINTVDDRDSIGTSELTYLTDRLRETAVNVLPKPRYGVMTTQSIVAFLGSQENARKVCNESSCLAEIGRRVNADYVAQARVGRFSGNLTIKVELYNSRKGNLIGSFTGESKNLPSLLSVVSEKAPILFKQMPDVSGGSSVASPSVAGGGIQAQPTASTKTEPTIQGTVVPGGSLAQKLVWLQKSAESHETYIIEVNADESIAPYTFEFRGGINITVVLRGIGRNRTIRLQSHGTMFTVKKDVTFILDNNITLRGHNGNSSPMVNVNGGEFKMNVGSYITDNIVDNKTWPFNTGGGVNVSEKGTFTMSGGTISGNKNQWGGGVHILSGTFTMSGGTISGNTATEAGGGVYVNSGGTFVMSGGTIAGNLARRVGGGLQLWEAKFNMRGGIITGNTAGDEGGGLWYTNNSSFTKTGGTITGYKSDQTGNVVKDESGSVLARKGHAIYRGENQRKETTAGPEVNFSCNNNNCTGGWDE